MGFGIIAGAMGGLGQGMVNEAETLRKQDEIKQRYQSETDLVTLRANLETRKAKELADYNEGKTIATEQRKVAPLKRVGEAAQEIAGKEVPLQGSDVQSLEGGKGDAVDGKPIEGPGMQGNVGIIMKQMEDGIKNEADPATKQQKIQDFENIKKQIKNQQDAEAEGKTRTVGNDEAVKIALDKLKVSDPEAYAAYETTIGKSLRDERKLDNQANAAEIKDRRERELAMMRDATTRYAADLRSADSDKRLEALIGRLGGGQSGTKEALTFIDGQRKEIAAESAELRQLQKQSMEMGQDPAKVSAEFAPKFAALQRKRDQIEADFGSLREQVGLPASNQIKPTADGLDADLAARIADIAAKNKKAGTPSAAPSSSKEESTPYEPPIGSPAAKAKERRDNAAKTAANQSAVLSAVINDAAQKAIFSGDPAEALKVQGMPGFASLDRSTKTLIFNLVNGKK